jgi:translation initiation factor IF-3
VISTLEAISRAKKQGLDLVAINSKIHPPVCKILDYGKFRFDQSKRDKELAKSQRDARVNIKEVQLRPVIDQHDLLTKARKAAAFIQAGDKVKVVMKFRGREIHHSDIGRKVMEEFLSHIGEHKLERPITFSERQMFAVAAPLALVNISSNTVG